MELWVGIFWFLGGAVPPPPIPGWVYPMEGGAGDVTRGGGAGPLGARDTNRGWAPACCPQEGPHPPSPSALAVTQLGLLQKESINTRGRAGGEKGKKEGVGGKGK